MKAALLLVVVAAGAAAQEKPSEYVYSAPLVLDPGASHYRFTVPAAAYRGSSRRDLGDLRVFNAAGEPVPYAFAPRESHWLGPASQAVKLFPLHGDREKGLGATNVRVERTKNGAVVNVSVSDPVAAPRRALMGYVFDTSELAASQDALLFTWQATEGFSGRVRVEASEDLISWRTLVSNAPVLSLEHAGARLERNRVELSGIRAKYLRVAFDGVPADFELKEVRVELRPEKAEPRREWLSLTTVPGKTPGELIADTLGHFPVDRVRLVLPQPNTIASIRIDTRDRTENPWRPAGSAIAYRLAPDGGELTNPDIRVAVNADRYWRIVVDQKGGGFGAGEVKLELAWLPHEVLFAARGVAPFSLAYGNKLAKPGASSLSSVLPNDEHLAPRAAAVGEMTRSVAAPPSLFGDPVRFFRGVVAHPETKKWTLWVALLTGVLFLGWMALRLLRDMGKTPPDSNRA